MDLKNSFSYAKTQEGRRVVRLCMDRALGCTYPEDRMKTDKDIIDFLPNNMAEFKLCPCIKKDCENGQITEKEFIQCSMELKLTQTERIGN